MIPNQPQTTASFGSSVETIAASFHEDSLIHLADVYSDLYVDRQLALLREYGTNAWDAHVAAGVTRPIEVTITDEVLRIQDWGPGLNVDDVRNVYSKYGASNKRDSNDFTGSLGLGCKAGFAYSFAGFDIHAVKNGVKTLAKAYKNDQGAAMFDILDTRSTTEPNGVTIEVPLKDGDAPGFLHRAEKFFAFWEKGQALVNGKDLAGAPADALWIDENTYVLPRYGQAVLIMGNVPYTRKGERVPIENGLSIVSRVPIGSLAFVPSREELRADTPLNTETFYKVVKTVEDGLVPALLAALEERPGLERYQVVGAWAQSLRSLPRDIRDALPSEFRVPTISFEEEFAFSLSYEYNYRLGQRLVARTLSSLRLDTNNVIDGRWLFVTGYPNRTVTPKAKAHVQAFCKNHEISLDSVIVTGFSTLPEPLGTYYKNTITYEEVVASTTSQVPKAEKKSGATQYKFLTVNGAVFAEKLDDDSHVAYADGSLHAEDSLYRLLDQLYPDLRLAVIRDRQVDRFRRLHPNAVAFFEYRERILSGLESKVTPEFVLHCAARRRVGYGLKSFLSSNVKLLDDPSFAFILKVLGSNKHSQLHEEFTKFSHLDAVGEVASTYPAGGVHDLVDAVLLRYPLLNRIDHSQDSTISADLILYLNAKFQQINNPTNGAKS